MDARGCEQITQAGTRSNGQGIITASIESMITQSARSFQNLTEIETCN